ncbi:30S ribosomal protein S12 methylthiotransferase RimO [Megalodesulfovibrio gigas]|uniref:Ribosomal protein uS12 methylthiotransferase RimO n=1 Tax=Megalodesulfovibrio gigas (strain ATCC 19364 / DSM 1382 / NCIMB 9332 / VKM B-1759) TaxID=1121448 RepID=T2G8I0_MEGG1|nr:30S ribosomal protein S12 methylthiotransferase RimO [Megalodesulfovibrio gigas]AGW12573.1 putative MiaB-like tRNA modifying protein YliG [Megalodesulfovibrio gigas DSM 1382 = ATCC 19364]
MTVDPSSRPLLVHMTSLGCPKNRVDSERLLGRLGETVTATEDMAAADLVCINTCGFIEPAVEESLRCIIEAAQVLAEVEPRPLFAVAGCLVGRYGQAQLAPDLPEVDLWLDLKEMDRWPALVAQALARRTATPPPVLREHRRLSTAPTAYLKISEGCNHGCSFCTIPSIRGRLSSRSPEELVHEARAMLAQGARELVIVGQDVTAYGKDAGLAYGLPDLLARLLELPGLDWLRLMYLYPAGITRELLGFIASAGPRLLPYFDMPLQHAHPAVLKAMGRPFAQDPRRVVDSIRAVLPQAALRTSLIVGFPGEGEAEFQALQDFVENTRFQHLGVFAYCAEEGTPAAELPGQVPPAEREARREILMARQKEISRELLETHVGEEMDVLVEAVSPEWPGLHLGRVWLQAPEVDGVTYVSGEGVQPGAMVRARIEDAKEYDLVALA